MTPFQIRNRYTAALLHALFNHNQDTVKLNLTYTRESHTHWIIRVNTKYEGSFSWEGVIPDITADHFLEMLVDLGGMMSELPQLNCKIITPLKHETFDKTNSDAVCILINPHPPIAMGNIELW
jgi:hypothetical protein